MKGLYIHIPFCRQKCLYCDFASYAKCETLIPDYLYTLSKEAQNYYGETVDTIFVGGGTPSLLSEKNIAFLFETIYKCFNISKSAEITVEVNPESVTEEKIKALSASGANRISMGVQSFDNSELLKLGRIHDSKTAYTATEIIKKHISNFNLDIMTGIPQQDIPSLLKTLGTAVSLSPTHISCYSLIVEDGTPFFDLYADKTLLPDEETDREMYRLTCEILEKNGYAQYEISNFSKPGFECQHNLKYWNCEEYIGLGAAAHSYLNSERFSNTKSITDYINGNTVLDERITLSTCDKISEFIIMGLRKTRGIETAEFKRRFGRDIHELFSSELSFHIKNGFLEEKDGFLRLTRSGINVSNSVLCDFV